MGTGSGPRVTRKVYGACERKARQQLLAHHESINHDLPTGLPVPGNQDCCLLRIQGLSDSGEWGTAPGKLTTTPERGKAVVQIPRSPFFKL